MADNNDTIVFPEIKSFEDPKTGNEVVGERMTTDKLLDVQISPGGFEALDVVGVPSDEGERVFQLEDRGPTPESELGDKAAGEDVTKDDVFIRPAGFGDAPPDPRKVHQNRSEYAQAQDEARDARLTTDREKYASNPDSYDFPGVDTGPTFRQSESDFDTDSFLDSLF